MWDGNKTQLNAGTTKKTKATRSIEDLRISLANLNDDDVSGILVKGVETGRFGDAMRGGSRESKHPQIRTSKLVDKVKVIKNLFT